jgi:hypothetical protein
MIITKTGSDAKQFVVGISELFDDIIVKGWLSETDPTFCIIKYNNKVPVCIALLHKIEYDVLGIFENPVVLDYIYTMIVYRKNGYAYKLLKKLTKNNQIIGFSSNDEAHNLFMKCHFGFRPIDDELAMVRFPHYKSDFKT